MPLHLRLLTRFGYLSSSGAAPPLADMSDMMPGRFLSVLMRSTPVSDSTRAGSCAMVADTSCVTLLAPAARAVGAAVADHHDAVGLGERLRHGTRDIGQRFEELLNHGRLAVFLPGIGLLVHRLGLREALRSGSVRTRLTSCSDGVSIGLSAEPDRL